MKYLSIILYSFMKYSFLLKIELNLSGLPSISEGSLILKSMMGRYIYFLIWYFYAVFNRFYYFNDRYNKRYFDYWFDDINDLTLNPRYFCNMMIMVLINILNRFNWLYLRYWHGY